MKRPFRFYLPDGSVCDNTETGFLLSAGLTKKEIRERQQQRQNFYKLEEYSERLWRDRELLLTDRLMYEDSTISGQRVRATHYYQQLLEYRQALRDYDLKSEPRPERPGWFNLPETGG